MLHESRFSGQGVDFKNFFVGRIMIVSLKRVRMKMESGSQSRGMCVRKYTKY